MYQQAASVVTWLETSWEGSWAETAADTPIETAAEEKIEETAAAETEFQSAEIVALVTEASPAATEAGTPETAEPETLEMAEAVAHQTEEPRMEEVRTARVLSIAQLRQRLGLEHQEPPPRTVTLTTEPPRIVRRRETAMAAC